MVTKTQIAKHLGVSRTCVSLVLSDHPTARIAPDTRRMVLQAARRLGYRSVAPGVGTHRSKVIVYVLCIDDEPAGFRQWHYQVLCSLQHRVADDHRNLVFVGCNNTAVSVNQALACIDHAGPLGVILDGEVPEALVEKVQARDLPMVITGVTPYAHDDAWEGEVNTVSIDMAGCVEQTMQWLHDHGSRRIALVAPTLESFIDRLAFNAYQEARQRLGLEQCPSLVQICSEHSAHQQLLYRMRDLNVDYDGLLFASSKMANIALNPMAVNDIWQGKVRPPVAVVGFFDNAASRLQQAVSVATECATFTRMAYDLLAATVKAPGSKPRRLMAPLQFHDLEPSF